MELTFYLFLLPFAFFFGSGCTSLPLWLDKQSEGPPSGEVVQIAASQWTDEVLVRPDPTRGGKPTPALALRVNLFDKQLRGCRADGFMRISLILPRPFGSFHEEKPLEVWELNEQMLAPMVSRDFVTWGYTITLPWGTYHPKLTRFILAVEYITPDGRRVYHRANVKLAGKTPTFQVHRRNIQPAPAGPTPREQPLPQSVPPSVSQGHQRQK